MVEAGAGMVVSGAVYAVRLSKKLTSQPELKIYIYINLTGAKS